MGIAVEVSGVVIIGEPSTAPTTTDAAPITSVSTDSSVLLLLFLLFLLLLFLLVCLCKNCYYFNLHSVCVTCDRCLFM